jgi:3-oxoadipate enol-lactonase
MVGRAACAIAHASRTITFDYRGTGDAQSPAVAGDAEWSTTSFAADAVAVLDRLGYDRVQVYGTTPS